MSYPYVEINNVKISLIPPFTINDELIIDMGYETNFNQHRWLAINHNGYFAFDTIVHRSYAIPENLFRSNVETNGYCRLRNTAELSDNAEIVRLSRDVLDAVNLTEHIISEIKCQTIRFADDSIGAELQCNRRLLEQGRIRITTCRPSYVFDALHNARAYTDDVRFNIDLFEAPTIIHSNTYKPEYKKHYLAGEDTSTTLLLGAEIEVDCGGKSEEHAKKVLEIMNGEDDWNKEINIYCVHDGSLKNGLEFPTQPCTLAYHKTLPYEEMFAYLDRNGYKAHDTDTCGLHVHINRSFFGDQEKECIGKLIYIVEKFNDEFSAIGRRNCNYARFIGYNGEKCKDLYEKGCKPIEYSASLDFLRSSGKYNAINLLHTDSIEIRAFKGTLKYSTFMNTLEFVSDLAHFVKTHTEEEVENMSWSDLYDTFSDELKNYYDERRKIEEAKTKKDDVPTTTVSEPSAATTCTMPVGQYEVYRPVRGSSRSFLDFSLFGAMHGDIIRQRSYEEALEEADRSINEYARTARNILSRTTEILYPEPETNEKKVKRLKKELKTTRNYIAKVKLQKEIMQLNKEIKLAKKKERKKSSDQ